ncbi:hypothetical protein MYMAC_001563 [Corallococcus macrosporus DSM 14697]|uniref:Uncharacterized protein n=3 Tax=Cystobacterineae TaxID=80811 RepID=A0A250JQ49_9BACT|nr:hypothetical protein MYMAC_001563 [Corallococcus macrosporus DSM 14697]
MASRSWVPEPVKYMDERVPAGFFLDTLRALRDANRIAAASLRGLEADWRKGAFAHVRREFFNQLWGPVARKYGGRARAVLNANFATKHLEVTLGGIKFTAVAVQSPNEFPREAEYRTSLAGGNQLSMLARMGMEEEQPLAEAQLYAVFGYSSDVEEESGLPVFAHVGFPHHRKKKYVDIKSLHQLIRELGGPLNSIDAARDLSTAISSDANLPSEAEFEVNLTDAEPPLRIVGRDNKAPNNPEQSLSTEFEEERTEDEPHLSIIPRNNKIPVTEDE